MPGDHLCLDHRGGPGIPHEGLQGDILEAGDGGALFLNEIGDVTTGVQRSPLRALEGGEITCLGESKPRKVDVRFIAATQSGRGGSEGQFSIRTAVSHPSCQN